MFYLSAASLGVLFFVMLDYSTHYCFSLLPFPTVRLVQVSLSPGQLKCLFCLQVSQSDFFTFRSVEVPSLSSGQSRHLLTFRSVEVPSLPSGLSRCLPQQHQWQRARRSLWHGWVVDIQRERVWPPHRVWCSGRLSGAVPERS